MARQARRLAGRIAAEAGDRQRCFAVIRSLVAGEPKIAKELAEQYLLAWSGRLQGGSDSDVPDSYRARYGRYRRRYQSYPSYRSYQSYPSYSPYGGYARPGGVPLLRTKQVQNLAELAELLSAIQALKVPPSENVLVGVFDACHSPAEVYREDDLRGVFGMLESLRPETLLQLVSTLRMKLADQWRKPEVQEQAATQPHRPGPGGRGGARLRVGPPAAGRRRRPPAASVEPVLLQGTLAFDLAEFLYGQKADLKTYTSIRDQAFVAYRRAARLLRLALRGSAAAAEREASATASDSKSALGASDLAYLTRQDCPDLDEIDCVAAAMRGLGGEAAARDLTMFGQGVVESISEIPPHLKPHYLRQAGRVLAGQPAGEPVGSG